MKADEARRALASADDGDEGVVDLPLSVLSKLTVDDVPDGVEIQVGTHRRNVLHLD